MSQGAAKVHLMTFNDKSQHPSVTEKDVGLVLVDGRMNLQIKKRAFIVSNDEVRITISTEDGEHLRWCLQDALFDEAILNQGMPKDYYGDDTSEPF